MINRKKTSAEKQAIKDIRKTEPVNYVSFRNWFKKYVLLEI